MSAACPKPEELDEIERLMAADRADRNDLDVYCIECGTPFEAMDALPGLITAVRDLAIEKAARAITLEALGRAASERDALREEVARLVKQSAHNHERANKAEAEEARLRKKLRDHGDYDLPPMRPEDRCLGLDQGGSRCSQRKFHDGACWS